MEEQEAVKRFTVHIPDPVAEDLQKWGDVRGQRLATIAAVAIEQAVEAAKQRGEIPPVEAKKEAAGMLLAAALLTKLVDGTPLSKGEQLLLAEVCGRPPEQVLEAIKKIQGATE